MKKKKNICLFILKIGSVLIFLSGIVSIIVSIPVKAIYNGVDPNGLFGHIGIVNGIAAIFIGTFLFWFSFRQFTTCYKIILAGLLMIVLGHIGAIFGALLIGTAGLVLSYTAGIWSIVLGIKCIIKKT